MKVRLYTKRTIQNYTANNPQCFAQSEGWMRRLKKAKWNFPVDILQDFVTADLKKKAAPKKSKLVH
jgi:hypothetical protein